MSVFLFNAMLTPREKNILIIGQVSGNSFYTIAFNGVMTLFLLKIGAKEGLIGFLAILPSLIGVGSVLLIPWVERNYPSLLKLTAFYIFVLEFLLLPIFLIAHRLTLFWNVFYYTAFLFLFYIFTQIANLAWLPTIQDYIAEEQRGRFFGTLRLSFTLFGYLLLRVSSRMLGPEPDYIQFFWVITMGVVLSAIWPFSFTQISEPKPHTLEREEFSPGRSMRVILNNRELSKYFWFVFIWSFWSGFVGPFMVPFYKTVLHLPSSFCIYLNSMTLLGMGGLAFAWGKLNDYRGSRFVLFVSFVLGLIFWIFMAHLKMFPPDRLNHVLVALCFFGGIAGGGQLMGDTTRRMGLAPETGKVAFYSYLLIVGGQLPAIIASPLAGVFIERHRGFVFHGYGIYEIIFLTYAVFNLFFLVQILWMKPIREKPVGEIFRDAMNENLMKVRDLIASPP